MEQFKLAGFTLLLWAISIAGSPQYPDTLRVPVTFYDFHSDGSNPEFQIVPACTGGAWAGMVETGLSIHRKPHPGNHPFFNLSVDNWFWSWQGGDYSVPNYGAIDPNTGDYPLANAAGLTPKYLKADHDTAFKNIVIQDTLFFSYVTGSNRVYRFDDQSFFPLDGKGFGAEGKEHNFSFTMEMHWKFTMAAGLRFEFTGDDDVWAFIDNRLVMDLGGRHTPQSVTIDLDSIREKMELTDGQDYAFDFFYCERHTSEAVCKITSSIMTISDSVTGDCPFCSVYVNKIKKGVTREYFDCERIENQNAWWQENSGSVISFFFRNQIDTFTVTAQNIDSLFPLPNGHSWVPRKGSISCHWDSTFAFAKVLIVQYQYSGNILSDTPVFIPPTISIGDTVRCIRDPFKADLKGRFDCLWNQMLQTPVKNNQIMLLPAQGVADAHSHCTEKGMVFTFNSNTPEGIYIRIVDLSGRFVEGVVPEDLQMTGKNRFLWNYHDKRFNKRMAKGIYFAQVFRNEKLIKSIPLIIN